MVRTDLRMRVVATLPELSGWTLKFCIQYSESGNFYTFGIKSIQIFISHIFTVLGPLGEKFILFMGFEPKSDFDHKTSEIKSHSTRFSKRYLGDKSPIHGRSRTAMIFQYS